MAGDFFDAARDLSQIRHHIAVGQMRDASALRFSNPLEDKRMVGWQDIEAMCKPRSCDIRDHIID